MDEIEPHFSERYGVFVFGIFGYNLKNGAVPYSGKLSLHDATIKMALILY